MPKSLAEHRAAKPRARAERAHTVCLAPHLVAEVGTLTDELQSVAVKIEQVERQLPSEDDSKGGPPQRLNDSPENQALRSQRDDLKDRAEQIKARMSELLDEMAEDEGELRVRAVDDGDWRLWTDQHPAREKGEPGHKRDEEVTGGYCNADDLIDDLATYVWSWNGERLADGDWDLLGVSPADKKQIATLVVSLYESDASIPKWRSALSENLRNESA